MTAKKLSTTIIPAVFILTCIIYYAGKLYDSGDNFNSAWKRDSSEN